MGACCTSNNNNNNQKKKQSNQSNNELPNKLPSPASENPIILPQKSEEVIPYSHQSELQSQQNSQSSNANGSSMPMQQQQQQQDNNYRNNDNYSYEQSIKPNVSPISNNEKSPIYAISRQLGVEMSKSQQQEFPNTFARMTSSQLTDVIPMMNCYFFGYEKDTPQIIKFDPLIQGFMRIIPPKNMEIYDFCSATYLSEANILIAGGLRDETIISNKLYQYNAFVNTAEELEPFKIARFAHQVTFYNDNLYIVGGIGENHQHLKSCEMYSVKEKKWKELPELNISRAFGVMFIFKKEIYLLAGVTEVPEDNPDRLKENITSKHSKKIEKFDNTLNKWVILNVKMPIGIDNTFACSFDKDEIQFIGGQTQALCLNINFGFNLKTGHYNLKKFMKTQRVVHKGMVHETSIWIFGGDDANTIEKYDILRDEWTQQSIDYTHLMSDMQTYGCTCSPLYVKSGLQDVILNTSNEQTSSPSDVKYFLFGDDYTSFVLEINFTKRFIKEYSIPYNLQLYGYQGVCKLNDGRYFFNGGMNITNSYISNGAYLYFPYENRAIKLPKSYYCKYTFSILVKGDYVYTIGGRTWGNDEVAIMKSCERYSIVDNLWEKVAELNHARCSSMTFIYKDQIYIAGGYGAQKDRCTSIERYDENKDKWEILPIELSIKFDSKSGICSGLEGSYALQSAISGNYYFIGGRSDFTDANKIWQFDIERGETWEIGALQDRKSLSKVCKLGDGRICILGGESKMVEFFNIRENISYEDDFGTRIEIAISRIFLISSIISQVRLIRQSLA